MKNKRKISLYLIILALFFSFGIFNLVYSQGGSSSCPTGEFCNPLKYNKVEDVVINILDNLRNVLGVIAVLFVVIGGLMYILSSGDEKRIETAKKIITGALIGLAIILAAPSLLKAIGEALGWKNPPSQVSGATDLATIAKNILKFLLSVSGIVAIIFLVFGGLTYMTSYGSEERSKKGTKIITYAVIGIVVILSALAIVTQLTKFF